MAINKTISKENILQILEERFNQNLYRHPNKIGRASCRERV